MYVFIPEVQNLPVFFFKLLNVHKKAKRFEFRVDFARFGVNICLVTHDGKSVECTSKIKVFDWESHSVGLLQDTVQKKNSKILRIEFACEQFNFKLKHTIQRTTSTHQKKKIQNTNIFAWVAKVLLPLICDSVLFSF